MTGYLRISATFLDSRFHGRADGDAPEWPPSPMRLFQALLAGARTGCCAVEWSESKAEAFRWLESREPPLIYAPDAPLTSGYTFFVPDNVSDKVPERQERLVGKTARPCRLDNGDTVYYLWEVDDNDRMHAEILCREARHMLALGWGIDQVVGNGRILSNAEAAALPGKRWRPRNGFRPGEQGLRVPISGSLSDLEKVHQSFLERIDGKVFHPSLKPSQFRAIHYFSANTVPPRSYAPFELPDGISFGQEDIAKVAAMLRSVACNYAQSDTHDFPGGSETYVAGHTGKQEVTPPRFSYLPLPSIGHEHADGRVRRFLIAEPYGGDGEQARWAQQRLHGATILDNEGNERGILLDPGSRTSRTMFGRYSAESRTWYTVTPVFLPGYDDGVHTKAEKLLLAAIRQAGLPAEAISDITLRKAPFFSGSQHPRQYFVPEYLRGRPGWHVRLTFRESVPGPLAIGAGRHAGLGVFARSED